MMRSILVAFLLLMTLFVQAQGTTFEAEDATLEGVSVAKSRKGYSGTGYVTGFDTAGDKIVFNFNWETAGRYSLYIGFAAPNGDKKNYVIVNGETLGELAFASSTTFKELNAGKISLLAGSNTISIEHSWGWFEVDYIRIDAAESSTSWNISPTPVNPNISPEALSMYQFLLSNFGKTTFAGQFQNEDRLYTDSNSEIAFVKKITGKYPAVYGNDLIDYSPSRVEHGSTSNATTDILKWYNERQGMVTLTWHWNAPTDLYDTSEESWWSGFYTKATSFNIATVINDPESERYQLLLRDIDAIAEQLKIYQENNIPILWRPLHEAEGAWFWWGAKGSAACVKLWKLVYDRLTNYHQINNLIWVWTTSDSDDALNWYPGDDYVDILGVDVYLNAGDYSASSAMFDNLRNMFAGKKMLTMSENGTIPDPQKMEEQDAKWLYNCTWVGDFITNGVYNSQDHISYFFNHENVTTLDELPESWTHYVDAKEINQTDKIHIYPNPVTDQLHLDFDSPESNREITLLNAEGRTVFHQSTNGNCTIETSAFAKGIYVVRIKEESAVQSFKITKR